MLHRGAKFDFVEVTLPGLGGRTLVRQMVEHPGAVIILPILLPMREGTGRDGAAGGAEIVLIENERFSVGKALVELPAGTLEAGEDPAACAARELEEETGFAAATIEPLGRFYTSPGLSNEVMHAFVARGLTRVGQRLEPDERIRVRIERVEDAIEMVRTGAIEDAKTMLTLLLARDRGLLGPGSAGS